MKVEVSEDEIWPAYYLYELEEEDIEGTSSGIIDIPKELFERSKRAWNEWSDVQSVIESYAQKEAREIAEEWKRKEDEAYRKVQEELTQQKMSELIISARK